MAADTLEVPTYNLRRWDVRQELDGYLASRVVRSAQEPAPDRKGFPWRMLALAGGVLVLLGESE